MSRRPLLGATGLLLFSCTGPFPAPKSAPALQRTVLVPGRVLDPGSGMDRTGAAVIVEGSRIRGVVPLSRYRPAPDDRRIDLPGTTLLPGLIDAHVHLGIGGTPRANAVATVRAGFTTVADQGATTQRIQVVRDSIAAFAWEGPRILAAGLWIGIRGGVCEFGGIGVPGNPEAFRARVRENVAAGADIIKACVSGWPAVAWAHPDSAELSLPILAALVEEARRLGRPVTAHAVSRAAVRLALAAGVTGLVHTPYLDEGLADRMREQGMWLVPTLTTLAGNDTSPPARDLRAALALARRRGVTLVFGTDAGVLPHGENAGEALTLSQAGFTPLEILRAATANAARALGLADSLGAIRVGMTADLVAVAGDPRSNLALLATPVFVMARGRIVKQP